MPIRDKGVRNDGFTEVVPNLKAHHRALLALLGERYVTLYANSG